MNGVTASQHATFGILAIFDLKATVNLLNKWLLANTLHLNDMWWQWFCISWWAFISTPPLADNVCGAPPTPLLIHFPSCPSAFPGVAIIMMHFWRGLMEVSGGAASQQALQTPSTLGWYTKTHRCCVTHSQQQEKHGLMWKHTHLPWRAEDLPPTLQQSAAANIAELQTGWRSSLKLHSINIIERRQIQDTRLYIQQR